MLVMLIADSVVTMVVIRRPDVGIIFGAGAIAGNVDLHTNIGRSSISSIAGEVAVSSVATCAITAPSVTSRGVQFGSEAGRVVAVGTWVVELASLVVPFDVEGVSCHTSSGSGLLWEKDGVGVALEPSDAMRTDPPSASCGILAP